MNGDPFPALGLPSRQVMKVETALRNFDNPINSFEEDLLQRQGFVTSLCQIVEVASPDESTVFALHGEWGAGKTSVKNLLKKELAARGDRSPLPIEFNPWAFSGQDQVLEAFFSEIGKGIGREKDGAAAAEGFKKMGGYLSFGAKTVKTIHIGMDLFGIPGSKIVGMVGEQVEGGAKGAKEFGEEIGTVSQLSLEQVHNDLRAALGKLSRPLLIILDDLDRLTPDQLLLIFQIVKLNANLPRVNYILLMDGETIANRLKQKGLGVEFIDKIVQFEVALPHVTADELKEILKDGFTAVAGKYAPQIDWERWEEGWTNGAENLFTTLRRVKRFLHTLKFHLGLFASDDVLEVDPVDLFMVEAVRKFAPGVHAEIPRIIRPVVCPETATYGLWLLQHSDKKHEFGQAEIKTLAELAPAESRAAIQRILELLFPQVGNPPSDSEQELTWIKQARICHRLFFDSFFRLGIPRQLPTQQEIKELFDAAADAGRLRKALQRLHSKVGLQPLLVRVQGHHRLLKPEFLKTLLVELWRLDEFDAKEAGIERKWDTRWSCQAITRFLLQTYCEPDARAQILVEVHRESGCLVALAYYINAELNTLEQEPHSGRSSLTKEDLDKLREHVVAALRKGAAEGHLLDSPDSGILLHIWAKLDSKSAVSAWADSQVKDAGKLPHLLSRLIGKSTTSSHRETKVHHYIPRKVLESILTLDAAFQDQLAAIKPDQLPHWEKFAVQETLKHIADKKAGREEVDCDDFA